nr:hypothetical protein BaRGS_030440 [Batillaria attramentaria]
MLRDKRWDVISNAVLCRVWEDVRRSVLKAAVEQREWTTVKHMADHSLYDDERNWALMEAFYQGRWSVVIALAEFGHDRDQLRRIYRQVAKHAHWDTVIEIFDRGAEVRNVREELETANISRKRLPRLAVLAGYEYRLLQLYMLEDQVESEAQNIEHAIQQNNWRAVLHKVRREASTFSLALHAAIEKEAWHVVVQLVRLGMDAAQRDSLFPEVIRRRQWGVGRALLECGFFDGGEHGVSVELRRAALPQLVNVGQWILVARVMEHGVDDEERRQVMWEALDRREGSVVAHIISIMEDRVTVEERERVFQQALSQGVWQALKRLVEFKDLAGIGHRDVIIRSAAKHHQWDILTHCLRYGADIDKRDDEGDTMLHKAAREDDWEGVEGLLYHGGANQNLLDKKGQSVLHKAFKEPDQLWRTWRSDSINWDVVKMLVEFQCDINQPDPHGNTPLQRMIEAKQGEMIKCCTMWGRDVGQAVSKEGKTALHAVCEAGVLDTMHIIVARGGDPLAVTRQGETILLLAVRNRKHLHGLLAECIKLGISTHQPHITDHWMEHGLRLYSLSMGRSATDSDFSPLYYAVCHRSLAITKMLYESGSCSNRELYNIAHVWFNPANHTHSSEDPPSIRADQAAYVSMIVSSPRSLQSMCRLVISHHIGVCKPRRREQRVKQLPILSRKMKNYVLFSDLTDPELDKKRRQWSVSTDIPWWYKFDTDAE